MKNTCKKAVAYLLCLILLLSVQEGWMGGKMLVARGASLPISRIDADQILDAKYRWQAKFTAGKTQARQENCDNIYLEQFLRGPRGDWGTQATEGIASLPQGDRSFSPREAPGCYYSNVGQLEDAGGNLRTMDMKLSITASYGGKNRYDYRTPSLTTTNPQVQPTGSTLSQITYSWDGEMGRPCVSFLKNSIGLRVYCVDGVDVTITYYDHQTGVPLAVSGHGTLSDIDGQQSVGFPEGSNISQVYLLKESEGHLSIGDRTVESKSTSLSSDSRRGDLTYLFDNTPSVTIHFSYKKSLETMTDNYKKALAGAGGSKEELAQKMKKAYYGSNGETLMPHYSGGEWVTSHATFSYTSKVVGRFVAEPSELLEKRIGSPGSSWEGAQAATKEAPYWLGENESLDYLVRYALSPSVLREFVLMDTLPLGLIIDNIHQVTVCDKNGKEVTGSFAVSIGDGRQITCRAAPEAMEADYFSDNQIYTFRFQVHRRSDVIPPLEADNYTYLLPNQASLRIQYEQPSGEISEQTYQSNQVFAGGRIVPGLLVEKRASRYEWQVGDTVDYTVKVTQTKQGAWAQGVVISDADIPGELKLLDGFTVEEHTPTEHFVMAREGENGWKCTGPLLNYDESVVIHFQCLVTEEANGGEWQNYAYATAKNYVNEKTGVPLSPASAREEIWVNSPKLTVEKSAGHFEWQVGEEVEYTMVVANQTPGTLARDVVISDEELPDGLILMGGAEDIRIEGLPELAGIPRRDDLPEINMEQKEVVEANIQANGGGWQMELNYLPGPAALEIHFTCKITGNPNGGTPEAMEASANGKISVNKATVSSANSRPLTVGDTEDIYVNSACLYVDKEVDHYEWQVGETVLYTVTVENIHPGTIARNLTIRDGELPLGLSLAEGEEAVVLEGVPQTISQPRKTSDDQGEWEEKEVTYQLDAASSSWQLCISDLPSQMPVRIQFCCVAEVDGNGQEAVNAVQVKADNGVLVQDDARIYINTALLTVEKSLQNVYANGGEQDKGDGRLPEEFRVGEEVSYEVRVENIYPGSIARNLVLEDTKLPSYLQLCAIEKIQVEGIPLAIQNPVVHTVDEANQLDPQYYGETEEKEVITQICGEEGGWKLRISDLPANMPVTVTYRCRVMEEANGKVIVNMAKAYAENGKMAKDTERIWVNTPRLAVTKSPDRETYLLGDTQTYTIRASQTARGCVARSVILEDTIMTEGVKLSKGSIVLLDQERVVMEAQTAVRDQAFAIVCPSDLVHPEGYLLWDGEEGREYQKAAWNPLELSKETELSVEYQLEVTDINLAGKHVENMARVNSMEGYPAKTQAKALVLAPKLRIFKESDKKEYHVGEVVYYHIRVDQQREQAIARNIHIADTWDVSGLVLKENTVWAAKNEKRLDNVQIQMTDRGFLLDTGTDLEGTDYLDIYYQMVAQEPSLAQEEVRNTALAKAENAAEVSHETIIRVEDLCPVLTVEKSSDQEQYEPGETGHYQVKVTQTRADAVARNVVLTDEISLEGARILPETVVIRNLHGVILSQAEIEYIYGAGKSEVMGYTIYTGQDLSWQGFLTVEYDVAFSGENTNRKIRNTARATADMLREADQEEKEPLLLEGVKVTKMSDIPAGTLVKQGDVITYGIRLENTSQTRSPNLLVKDALPGHTKLVGTQTGETGPIRGRQMDLDGTPYITYFIPGLEAGASCVVGFRAEVQEVGKQDWIVNAAQVRTTMAKAEDVTEDTYRSGVFQYTNETVHFVDSLWVSTEHLVDVLARKDGTPPDPEGTVTPNATPSVTGDGNEKQDSPKEPKSTMGSGGYEGESASKGTVGVSTGDETPVWWYVGAAALGGTLAAVMLLWKKRRR